MLSYLSNEAGFIRAFGNRSLLLFFLCMLTRSGVPDDKAAGAAGAAERVSVLGLSIDISPGIIVIFGPLLSLLVLLSLKMEADNLAVGRLSVLDDAQNVKPLFQRTKLSVRVLFIAPLIAVLFFFVQYLVDIALNKYADFDWKQHFGFSLKPGPAIFCIGDLSKGMPLIYPPWQTFAYIVIVCFCVYLTYSIESGWAKYRG
jgi:hypothetical protein